MTCAHCCDTNIFFDKKNADKELKKYIKKGPLGATKALLKAMSDLPKENKTLLDVGGGIGVLQWEFLKEQASMTTDVDASIGYLETAKTIASEFDYEKRTIFIQGDLIDVVDQLKTFDFVTLDKVICCYPDYEVIVKNALSKTNEYIAISYPISNVLSKVINRIGRLYFKIKRSEFKTYIHPSKKIEQLILNQGFKIYYMGISFPWNVQIYHKATINY